MSEQLLDRVNSWTNGNLKHTKGNSLTKPNQ